MFNKLDHIKSTLTKKIIFNSEDLCKHCVSNKINSGQQFPSLRAQTYSWLSLFSARNQVGCESNLLQLRCLVPTTIILVYYFVFLNDGKKKNFQEQ